MGQWKDWKRILQYNKKVLIGFELIYKLIMTVILIPIVFFLLDVTMNVAGYRYLTAENVFRFLKHPLLWIYILACVLIGTFLALIDAVAVIYITDESYHGYKTDLFRTARAVGRFLLHMKQRKQLCIFITFPLLGLLYILPVLPFVISRLSLPGFILRRLAEKEILICLLLLLVFAMLFCFFTDRFRLHSMVLEQCSGCEARHRARKLAKGRTLTATVGLILFELMTFFVYAVIVFVLVLILMLLTGLPSGFPGGMPRTPVLIVFTISLIVFADSGIPAGFLCLGSEYYAAKREKSEAIVSHPYLRDRAEERLLKSKYQKKDRKQILGHRRNLVRLAEVGIVLISVMLSGIYLYESRRGLFNPKIEYVRAMEITAHRGASRRYPENTMPAFEGAIKEKANWIELDVHLSKDGQVFVMHDSNFQRTTGVNAYAWEKTYEEILQLDAGKWFSKEFVGTKIPLLSEVIELAKKHDIRLNVEIKPSKYEKGLEKKVVELLKDENFLENAVITSQSYGALRKIKAADEETKTVYVMSYAYGKINRLKLADAFSIRSTSVHGGIVSTVHNAGKEIYAWTVNSSYAMDEMIHQNVDNIITDNVPLAERRIAQHKSGDLLSDFIRIVNDLI